MFVCTKQVLRIFDTYKTLTKRGNLAISSDTWYHYHESYVFWVCTLVKRRDTILIQYSKTSSTTLIMAEYVRVSSCFSFVPLVMEHFENLMAYTRTLWQITCVPTYSALLFDCWCVFVCNCCRWKMLNVEGHGVFFDNQPWLEKWGVAFGLLS